MKEEKNVITIDDILGKEISDEENVATVNKDGFLDNPLPVPKRHVRNEMDYAIKVDDNDDFDIKDMTGIDFFDYD